MSPPRRKRLSIREFLEPGGPPSVIAHRGLSGSAPENTLAAFRAAVTAGADMVEFDVTLSADGEVVVIHDAELMRTTDGSGSVRERSLQELRALDAGSWFHESFAGERIPTLDEVLDQVGSEVLLNVEIKEEAISAEAEGGIVDRVIRRIREHRLKDRVILSSFEPEALLQARSLDHEIARASLFDKDRHAGRDPLEVMDAVSSSSFNLAMDEVNASIVAACHAHGRLVLVYTVNRRADMERMLALGADGLFTDHADLMLRVLEDQDS